MSNALPFIDPVFIALLRAAPLTQYGSRVGVDIENPLPALRVSVIRDRESAVTHWERTPIAQVEVWAEPKQDLLAGTIAAQLVAYWRTITPQTISGAYVSGAWVETNPRPMADTESDKTRYLFEVGLRLHPPKEISA